MKEIRSRGVSSLFVIMAFMLPTSQFAFAGDENQTPEESGQVVIEEHGSTEILWELDPYYSNVSANIPLTSKPIPTITSGTESEIYRELIRDSLIPRYMLIEASIYPLPLFGTYLKNHAPTVYEKGNIGGGGINIYDSITAGFQEPWAASLFFGNIAKLERPGETRTGANMGYTGYLFSAGNKHIKENVLIEDVWHELEWKIKGKRDYPDEKMNWSFRLGGKFNSNPEITDVYYLGLYRSNLDHHAPMLRWLQNSSIDIKVQFSQRSGKAVREDFVIGKKFPLQSQSFTPTFDIGMVWESPNEYSGTLKNRSNSTLTLMFRPSIEF
ncbi:MAG TPA: hypothetical protein VGD24_03555 [Gallionella sp.]